MNDEPILRARAHSSSRSHRSSTEQGHDVVTVGIDIGTTSVKALAVDERGTVMARARVPHHLFHESADHLEHDATAAWRRGPKRALADLRRSLASLVAGSDRHRRSPAIAGVCVAGMVPSLTAVDERGVPSSPGLLYGDLRGRGSGLSAPDDRTRLASDSGGPMPDAEGFLRWTVRTVPGAYGYWPAQAVATHALSGHAAIDTAVSSTLGDLQRAGHWNGDLLGELGVTADQLPRVVPIGVAAGMAGLPSLSRRRSNSGLSASVDAPEPDGEVAIAGGTIDAFCDQLVAGADQVGDVLVILGATLITWVVTDEWIEVPGLWTVPHTVPGKVLIGGPSNAGALFVDWARSLLRTKRSAVGTRFTQRAGPGTGEHASEQGVTRAAQRLGSQRLDPEREGDPERVPVWLPYLRGERVPYHDPSLRAGLFDLDITDGPGGLERAAFESSGFVIRSILDRSGVTGRRIVASGGGTRVGSWMASVADATGLPVDTVATSEGAALGAAFLARMAAGLETSLDGSGTWSSPGQRYRPDPRWQDAADRRYRRFCELGSGP
ncbi:MAG: xylulokinase [Acidimicrobiales bacterium]